MPYFANIKQHRPVTHRDVPGSLGHSLKTLVPIIIATLVFFAVVGLCSLLQRGNDPGGQVEELDQAGDAGQPYNPQPLEGWTRPER